MSTVAITAGRYLSKNEVFADAFNYVFFNGKAFARPESLKELDPKELNSHRRRLVRKRDVLKAVYVNQVMVCIAGIENQATIHYAMPSRCLLYDALRIDKEVQTIEDKHRARKDNTSDNFISKFTKEDKIVPVVTITVNFSLRSWDGSLSMHDMFKKTNKRILAGTVQHHLNLIDPHTIPEADFPKFKSYLREVLQCLKWNKDKEKMRRLCKSRRFKRIDRDAAELIKVCTNMDFEIDESEENVDMCEAMQQLIDEAAENAARKATAKEQERARKTIAKANAKADEKIRRKREKIRKDSDKNYVSLCKKFGITFKDTIQSYAEDYHISKKAAETIVKKHWA